MGSLVSEGRVFNFGDPPIERITSVWSLDMWQILSTSIFKWFGIFVMKKPRTSEFRFEPEGQ